MSSVGHQIASNVNESMNMKRELPFRVWTLVFPIKDVIHLTVIHVMFHSLPITAALEAKASHLPRSEFTTCGFSLPTRRGF
jgi:hypothetical protein